MPIDKDIRVTVKNAIKSLQDSEKETLPYLPVLSLNNLNKNEAWTKLYQDFRSYMWKSLSSRYHLNTTDFDDCIMEGLTRFLIRWKYVDNPTAYLVKITLNLAKTMATERSRLIQGEISKAYFIDPLFFIRASEAYENLVPACRKVLSLLYGNHLTLEETAKRMKVKPTYIAKKRSVCLKALIASITDSKDSKFNEGVYDEALYR